MRFREKWISKMCFGQISYIRTAYFVNICKSSKAIRSLQHSELRQGNRCDGLAVSLLIQLHKIQYFQS